MQCCGLPFSVGDRVQWGVQDIEDTMPDYLGPIEGAGVEWMEDHCGVTEDLPSVQGTVTHIRAISQGHAPSEDGRYSYPVSGDVSAVDLNVADGAEIPQDPAFPDRRFTGYVVTLI